ITKGAERVAEVAARFSLDSLPGKQMSIDADLRSGDIDQAEARALRAGLQRESQLYGAMDGAMKFVKGDAIASIVVVLVNLIGGLAIGTIQQGKPIGAAAELYSLLTVGDGLVAQIPALLMSVAAGAAVTRVVAEEGRDLGADIAGQLFRHPRALALAAVVLLGLAAVPGFPSPVFLILALVFGAVAFVLYRLQPKPQPKAPAETGAPAQASASQAAPAISADKTAGGLIDAQSATILVRLGSALAGAVAPAALRERADRVRWDIYDDLGVELPAIGCRVDSAGIGADRLRIDIEGVPVAEADIPAGRLLVEDEASQLDLLGLPYESGPAVVGRREALWVAAADQGALSEARIRALAPIDVLSTRLREVLRANARN